MMQQRHGKATDQPHTDMATNYLGYWMDNGAYYYYHTLPNTTYQVHLSIYTIHVTTYRSSPHTASPSPCTCRTLCSPSTPTSPPGSPSGRPGLRPLLQVRQLRLLVVPQGRGPGGEVLDAPPAGGWRHMASTCQVFPDGLHFLYNQTGWRVAAHNRFCHLWSH